MSAFLGPVNKPCTSDLSSSRVDNLSSLPDISDNLHPVQNLASGAAMCELISPPTCIYRRPLFPHNLSGPRPGEKMRVEVYGLTLKPPWPKLTVNVVDVGLEARATGKESVGPASRVGLLGPLRADPGVFGKFTIYVKRAYIFT